MQHAVEGGKGGGPGGGGTGGDENLWTQTVNTVRRVIGEDIGVIATTSPSPSAKPVSPSGMGQGAAVTSASASPLAATMSPSASAMPVSTSCLVGAEGGGTEGEGAMRAPRLVSVQRRYAGSTDS